jgi:hypothetical protein
MVVPWLCELITITRLQADGRRRAIAAGQSDIGDQHLRDIPGRAVVERRYDAFGQRLYGRSDVLQRTVLGVRIDQCNMRNALT